MRKKTKNSLIVIVVLVAILGVGFGVYKNEILGRYAFYKGGKYFEAEEYEKATKYLKTSLGFNPDNPRTHLLLMKTYWARGLWEEMGEERDRIIALGEEVPPMPLIIKDLENATTTIRTTNNNGWPENDATWSVQVIRTDLAYERLGGIALDNNQEWYEDGTVYDEPRQMVLQLTGEIKPLSTGAENIVVLTYDSGQKLTVYLPEMAKDEILYIASDGSTYYNRRLTKRAQSAPRAGEVEEELTREWEEEKVLEEEIGEKRKIEIREEKIKKED